MNVQIHLHVRIRRSPYFLLSDDNFFPHSIPETQFLEISTLNEVTVPPQWIFPRLLSLKIRSINPPYNSIVLLPFWRWILVPTLTEINIAGWIYQNSFRDSLLSLWPSTLESLTMRCEYSDLILTQFRGLPIKTLQLTFGVNCQKYLAEILALPNSFLQLEKIVVVGTEVDLEDFCGPKDEELKQCCEDRGVVIVRKEVSRVPWMRRGS